MAIYLSDFHRKNSEGALEELSKQRRFSPEEMEAQMEEFHKIIEEDKTGKYK